MVSDVPSGNDGCVAGETAIGRSVLNCIFGFLVILWINCIHTDLAIELVMAVVNFKYISERSNK